MASELGGTTIDLEQDLIENGPAYDYYQAVRLVGLLARKKRFEGDEAGYMLRVYPELSLDYPSSDISSIKRLNSGSGIAITTTFMGLYGVSSPLPAYYTEELLDDEWDDITGPKGFLDVIHHHLYPLLYKAWIKHKFTHNAIENSDPNYFSLLYSLVGLGTDEIRSSVEHPELVLRYIGLLAQQRKSSTGLQTILSDLLNPIPVDIEPCVSRNVTILEDQRMRLGQIQSTLGESTVIGQEIYDRTGKFTIRLGPLNSLQYQTLMEDKDKSLFVRFIVKMYLLQPLDFDVVLSLSPGVIMGTPLSDKQWSRLGVDTWLYSKPNTDVVEFQMTDFVA